MSYGCGQEIILNEAKGGQSADNMRPLNVFREHENERQTQR